MLFSTFLNCLYTKLLQKKATLINIYVYHYYYIIISICYTLHYILLYILPYLKMSQILYSNSILYKYFFRKKKCFFAYVNGYESWLMNWMIRVSVSITNFHSSSKLGKCITITWYICKYIVHMWNIEYNYVFRFQEYR